MNWGRAGFVRVRQGSASAVVPWWWRALHKKLSRMPCLMAMIAVRGRQRDCKLVRWCCCCCCSVWDCLYCSSNFFSVCGFI